MGASSAGWRQFMSSMFLGFATGVVRGTWIGAGIGAGDAEADADAVVMEGAVGMVRFERLRWIAEIEFVCLLDLRGMLGGGGKVD
ncbi:hypothetical protein BDQ17DRAFT_1371283 [Cyathus striatus]|nr:hypothetical protein BDQ17DRAFT_1371283 [Cyathus striatus]